MMSNYETYQLTHPETLSEGQLREILKNSCIDFSHYEKLDRSELMDIYKRIAMPLPQRQCTNTVKCDKNSCIKNSRLGNDDLKNISSSSNTNTLKRTYTELGRISRSLSNVKSVTPVNDFKHVNKKLYLTNTKSKTECNGNDKRSHNDKHEDSPLRKRQKITWP